MLVTRLNGTSVFNKDHAAVNGLISVDMTKEEKGIYILTLKYRGKVSAYKIIKN
ncbi:MAG: hypothetical protein EOP47_23765 [Sphingobacteriaceae bacterium]|nr:MAG: hypothetical protein EOP47_23765 [Sphingobacteriaceae bacterium]